MIALLSMLQAVGWRCVQIRGNKEVMGSLLCEAFLPDILCVIREGESNYYILYRYSISHSGKRRNEIKMQQLYCLSTFLFEELNIRTCRFLWLFQIFKKHILFSLFYYLIVQCSQTHPSYPSLHPHFLQQDPRFVTQKKYPFNHNITV